MASGIIGGIDVSVSVIIPTKNGATYLAKTLEMIFCQHYSRPFEVIVIDSGSVDRTLEIVKRYPVRLVEIKPKDFGHGKTRNLGSELAAGEYIVFISQDAVPATERWLLNLVRNLERPEVAGIYGRQIPNEDTNPIERSFLNIRYPPYKIVKSIKQGQIDMTTIFFSNANSAIKKDILQRHPLLEKLIMSEDQEWAKRVLLNGYDIVYDPEAAVYHSHNYNLITLFKRYFDSGVSLEQIAAKEYTYNKFVRNGLNDFKKEMKYLVKNGYIKSIPYAPLYDLCKFVAVSLGKKERYLPGIVKRHLSMHSYYWCS